MVGQARPAAMWAAPQLPMGGHGCCWPSLQVQQCCLSNCCAHKCATPALQPREVPPCNPAHLLVAPCHPRYELLEEVARLILAEPVGPHDAVKQLAAAGILHGAAEVGARWQQVSKTVDVKWTALHHLLVAQPGTTQPESLPAGVPGKATAPRAACAPMSTPSQPLLQPRLTCPGGWR